MNGTDGTRGPSSTGAGCPCPSLLFSLGKGGKGEINDESRTVNSASLLIFPIGFAMLAAYEIFISLFVGFVGFRIKRSFS